MIKFSFRPRGLMDAYLSAAYGFDLTAQVDELVYRRAATITTNIYWPVDRRIRYGS